MTGQAAPHRTLALFLVSALLAANLAFGVIVVQRRAAALRLAPGATVSDLYFRWLGTRQLLFHRTNPYTEAAAREGERGFYGRPLTEREKRIDRENYRGFNYPLYVVVLLAPLALLPFPVVRVLATIGLAFLLGWSTLAWSRMRGWPGSRAGRVIVCAAVLSSLPALDLLSLQQLTGLVLGLLVAAVACLFRRTHLYIAAACVACATIKPQLAALPVLVMIFRAAARPRDRWPFLAATGLVLLLLVGPSLLLQPTWPAWFVANLRGYAAQVPASSLLGRLPMWPARALIDAVVVASTLAVLWLSGATHDRREDVLLDVVALSLAATLVVSVADHLYDRVLLVPALVSLGRLHAPRTVATLSAAGIASRLVVAVLAVILGGGATLGLLLQNPGMQLVRALTGVTLLGYVVLPIAVWLALLLSVIHSAARSSGRSTLRSIILPANLRKAPSS